MKGLIDFPKALIKKTKNKFMNSCYLIIVQARMGSTRLPGKVLKKLGEKTALEHVIERLSQVKRDNKIIVATSDKCEDDEISVLCHKINIDCFRGSENNVLDRFYQAAKKYGYDNIVRITGDCPMIDPEIVEKTILLYEQEKLDYATNVLPPTFPKGLDTEVFSFKSLERAWQETSDEKLREHVTVYFWQNPDLFKQKHLINDINLSTKRWVLDYDVDYKFLQEIFCKFYPRKKDFRMNDILEFLKANPELEKINEGIDRKRELANSLK